MPHVLLVDTTPAGLLTMQRAVELGYDVSFLRGRSVQYYREDDSFRRLLDRLRRTVTIDDTFDADLLTTTIREIHQRHPVDAVISQFDPILEALASACERLSLPFTSAESVANARDKARSRRVLRAAGLDATRFSVADNVPDVLKAAEQIGYPVVVKPVSGYDSVLACTARHRGEAAEAAAAIIDTARSRHTPRGVRELLARGVLVEEYLPGELVSAEIGVLDGRFYRFLISGRSRAAANDSIEVGAVMPANVSTRDADACFAYAERVCAALGLDFGIFHVELLLHQSRPAYVEANPRVMGGVMTRLYQILSGVDFCDHLIDLHLGRPPRPRLIDSGRTVTARRLMPQADGKISEKFDLDRLLTAAPDLANLENFCLEPGSQVRRQQVIGRFAVHAPTWWQAMTQANSLVADFERELELPLIHPAPVPPPATPAEAAR